MAFFTPPTPTYVPRVLASMSESEKKPMVYFTADIPVGQNIWWWTDNTISPAQPPLEQARTNADGTITPGVRKVWLGGRTHTITDAEAAMLTGAGYGSSIT